MIDQSVSQSAPYSSQDRVSLTSGPMVVLCKQFHFSVLKFSTVPRLCGKRTINQSINPASTVQQKDTLSWAMSGCCPTLGEQASKVWKAFFPYFPHLGNRRAHTCYTHTHTHT